MLNGNFLYIGNNNYFKYACASIYSLLENNQHFDKITIYYIDENLSETCKIHLERIVSKFNRKIVWFSSKSITDELEKNNIPKYKGTYAVYYRWFGYDLADCSDRMVYIDSDTIITGKLDKLFIMDMDNKPMAMCRDCIYDFYKKHIRLNEKPYFNTGVIVFDIKKCKTINVKEMFYNFLISNEILILYSEQDAASMVFNDYIKTLDSNFNVYANYNAFSISRFYKAMSIERSTFYTEQEMENAKSNPIIKHCSAFFGSRPWHRGSIHPYTDAFNNYFSKAGYDDSDKIDFKLPFVKKIVYNIHEPFKSSLYKTLTKIDIMVKLKKGKRK